MGVFHTFIAPLTLDETQGNTNADVPGPMDWNAEHLSPAWLVAHWHEFTSVSGGQFGESWVDMPAALTRFMADFRSHMYADLRRATGARLVYEMSLPGASGAELRPQYSTDGGTIYFDLGPVAPISTAGNFATAWATIPADARIEDCLIRMTGINGNGVVDPRFVSWFLYVR